MSFSKFLTEHANGIPDEVVDIITSQFPNFYPLEDGSLKVDNFYWSLSGKISIEKMDDFFIDGTLTGNIYVPSEEFFYISDICVRGNDQILKSNSKILFLAREKTALKINQEQFDALTSYK